MLQPNRNEEGTELSGAEGVWRLLNDFIGRRRTRTDGRTEDATPPAPFIASADSGWEGEIARARIHIASPSSGKDVASRRGSSPSDFCIRGGAEGEQKTLFRDDKGRREWPMAIKTRVPGRF